MKYEKRKYQCSNCGFIADIGTNHLGEIYSDCKRCDGSPLRCIEPEAIRQRDSRPIVETTLSAYRFNVRKLEESNQYSHYRLVLEDGGYKKFDSISLNRKTHLSLLKKTDSLDGKIVRLFADSIFENQWVEADYGLRLFDWQEPIFPNRDVKHGYFLKLTQEMLALRFNNWKCGYCGKIKPVGKHCIKSKNCKDLGMRPLISNNQKAIYLERKARLEKG